MRREDPPGDRLPRVIRPRYSAQSIEWRRVLAGEVDVSLWHAVPDGFDVTSGIAHADLKVAVTAESSEFIVAPLRCQEACRRTGQRIVVWESGVVRLEEAPEPVVPRRTLEAPNAADNVTGTVAESVEKQNIASIRLVEGVEADAF